jgi:class 3 adenylate cyclase
VTALFADIKGSTELMQDLDPEEARAIVDPALKQMIDAVRRYDGYVVQSTGTGFSRCSVPPSRTRTIRSAPSTRRSGCRKNCGAIRPSCGKTGTFRSRHASA